MIMTVAVISGIYAISIVMDMAASANIAKVALSRLRVKHSNFCAKSEFFSNNLRYWRSIIRK